MIDVVIGHLVVIKNTITQNNLHRISHVIYFYILDYLNILCTNK